jgi:hypothetical protein
MIAAEAMPGGAVTLSGRGMVHSDGRLVETGNAGLALSSLNGLVGVSL